MFGHWRFAALLMILVPSASLAAGSSARARLLDAQGKQVGSATLTPAEGGISVEATVSGLTPGEHGFHIHAVGKCEAPEFKSAGPHFNPANKKHGHDNPDGAHAGDLPNIEVGKDGKGKGSFVAKGVSLDDGAGSLFAGAGTALVVHADKDDGKTDPAGNAGARVACGVIERN
jgi:Cu-Zn family superoxide dismutase